MVVATIIAVAVTSLLVVIVNSLYPPDLPEYYVDEVFVKNCDGDIIWNGSLPQFYIEYPKEGNKLNKQYDLYPLSGLIGGGIPLIDITITICNDESVES